MSGGTPTADRGFDRASCGLLTTDSRDVVTRVNATFLEWTGYPAEAVVGRIFHDLLDPGSQAFYATRYQDELWSRRDVREISLRLERATGGALPILLNARMDADAVEDERVQLAVFDASTRQDFEAELLTATRAAEASEAGIRVLQDAASRFLAVDDEVELAAAVAGIARDAFGAVDVAVTAYEHDGAEYRILVGEGLAELLAAIRADRPGGTRGLERDEMVLIPDLDAAFALSDDVGELLRAARGTAFSGVSISDGDRVLGSFGCVYGRPRSFDTAALDLHRALARQIGLATSRVRLQQRLRQLASVDQLTGLANRGAIDDDIARAFLEAGATGEVLALLFLDLDGFKAINDELGHRAGDLVLQTVAQRIGAAVRGDDRVGRFGGDEFLVVCRGADAAAGEQVARRILDAVAEPIPGLPLDRRVTGSVGVAVHGPGIGSAPSPEILIRRADAAMYEAKRAGASRVALAR